MKLLILYMKKLLLFTIIFFISYCRNKPKDKVYLPKMKFERTHNPNYSNYLPDTQDTVNQNTRESQNSNNKNPSEPIPSFNSESISNPSDNKEKTSGFLASLFGGSGSKQRNSEERICSELLDINKTILTEQNRKLTSLKSNKKKLLDEINNLEKKYQRQKTQVQKENKLLEVEIDRLNRLIKILSTEIK